MKLIAIDPGTDESAYIVYDTETKLPTRDFNIVSNPVLLKMLRGGVDETSSESLAIEMVASYGMPVGKEVFETVMWIGRFTEAWSNITGLGVTLVYRKAIKEHLCGTSRAKDPHVRQALLDRFGGKQTAVGNAASPGPMRGITKHVVSALAVAVYAADQL